MSNVVRMGVVGAGAIAQRGIFPHLSQSDVQDRVTLHAVCDPAPGRAQAAADAFGIPHAYETFEELIANPDVDAITICSPIGLHFDQGMAALNAGKHIHFNKTMTTTTAEADQLIDLAKSKGLKIVSSPGEVLRPNLTRIREMLAEGAIGTPCWAVAGCSFGTYHETEDEFRSGNTPLSNVNPTWYFRKPGGGPMYDMASYCLAALTTIFGPVKRVTGMSALRVKEREFQGTMVPCDADDNTLAILDFGQGFFVFLHGTPAGWVGSGFHPRIFGTTGEINGRQLNGKPYEYPGWDQGDGFQAILPHVVGPHVDIMEQHVYEDVMQLVDWIREDKPTPCTAERARHAIAVIEAIYQSSAEGRAIEITGPAASF